MKFIGRWLITFIATWAAMYMVPGITFDANPWLTLTILSFVLALIDASIKPFIQLIGAPISIITLGIFYLVINALLLMLASWLSSIIFGLGIYMPFSSAFWASIVISLVSVVVGAITHL